MKQLEEIKARASAATAGPWKFDADNWMESGERGHGYILAPGPYDHDEVQLIEMRPEDASFIENARTDVPRLVAALEAVEDLMTWLDMVEEVHPSSAPAGSLNVSAAGTAIVIRKAIRNALEAA